MEQPCTTSANRMMSDDQEWLSQEELGIRWKVSKKTIRRLRQSGKLPTFEVTPALFRFRLADILRIESEGKFFPAITPRRTSLRKPKRR
jgi:hypothetical protein